MNQSKITRIVENEAAVLIDNTVSAYARRSKYHWRLVRGLVIERTRQTISHRKGGGEFKAVPMWLIMIFVRLIAGWVIKKIIERNS